MERRGVGVAVPIKRKERADKKINVNPGLIQDTHGKLVALAISCDLTKTNLAERLLEFALNHPDIINFFQDRHNKNPHLRVTPVREKGVISYQYLHR